MASAPFYRSWARPAPARSMAFGAQFSFAVFFAALLEEFGGSRAALPERSPSTPSATAPSSRSPAASSTDRPRVPIVVCFSYGAVGALVRAVVADFSGRGHACGLVGPIFTMAGSMSAWGPLGAGFIYDRTGSCGPTWVASTTLPVAALGLFHWGKPPRRLERLSLEEA